MWAMPMCYNRKIKCSIQMGDTLVSVNKLDVTGGYDLSIITERIREMKDPLLLDDVYSGVTTVIDINEYSEESACRSLSRKVQI
jgi:hypothetical protein